MIRRFGPALLAGVLLLAGCAGTDGEYIEINSSGVAFQVNVTGKAIVQWSDGVQTHIETIGKSGKHTWETTVDERRHIAAMTVVPVGKGSKASCTVAVAGQDGDDDDSFSRRASGPGKVATCLVTRQSDEPQPANARHLTLTPTTVLGGARMRAITGNGATVVNLLAANGQVDGEFTVLGDVYMVVVAQRAKDTVSCRIADGDTELATQTAEGLGAIATCHALVTAK